MSNLSTPNPRIYKGQRMADEDQVWKYPEPDCNPYHQEWQVLLDAIRQNKPHNEARRAGEANLTAIMGRAATHTGAMITRDEALKSEFQYVKDIDHLTFDSPAPLQAGPDGIYACPLPGVSKEI